MTSLFSEFTRTLKTSDIQGKTTLKILPLCGLSQTDPHYRLLEGDTLSQVKIAETSQSGSVPELMVENNLDAPLFLMDGQELVGAKQNRILNTDVLVAPKSSIIIPVSCVEAGRWHYTDSLFSPGKAASHAVRAGKHARVHESLKAESRYDANQSAVWQEVDMTLRKASVSSETAALHDAYLKRRKEIEDFRESLRIPDDAIGLAVFKGENFLGMDIFDRYSTLLYFWQSLVDSYAIDWLMSSDKAEQAEPSAHAIDSVLERAAQGDWENYPSPGEGRDFRLVDDTYTGSALVWQDKAILHLQMFSTMPHNKKSKERRPRIHRRYLQGQDEDVIL